MSDPSSTSILHVCEQQCSRETARMFRLAWAFAGRLCDRYHNLMSWLISAPTSRRISDSSTIRWSNFCDGSRIIGPRRTTHLHLQIIVMVNLLYSSYLTQGLKEQMSRNMTKPTKWLCAQQRLRSAWASAQSDQSSLSLSAWRKLGSLATHEVHSEDSDQTGRMPRLICIFAGRIVIWLVLSCLGSNERIKHSLPCFNVWQARMWKFIAARITEAPWSGEGCNTLLHEGLGKR